MKYIYALGMRLLAHIVPEARLVNNALRRHSYLSASLVLLAILTSCAGQGTPVPSTPDNSLLTGKPCKPPCWQGLIPGQSTWEETSDFLAVNPFVKGNLGSKLYAPNGKEFTQNWWWANENHTPERTNEVAIDKQGKVIEISLVPNIDVTVRQLVQTYGPPTLVAAATSAPRRRRGIVFTALYADQQLEINWLEETETGQGQFCPNLDTSIYHVSYQSSALSEASDNSLRDASPREGFILLDGNSIVKVVDGKEQINCLEIP